MGTESISSYGICVEHGRVNQDMDPLDTIAVRRQAVISEPEALHDFREWISCRNPSAKKVLAGEAELVPVTCDGSVIK